VPTVISFFIKTYGCQANVADSHGLSTYLQTLNAHPVPTEAQADLIIINTCAIREKAEQKLFSYIGQLACYKKLKPHLKIGIIGCVASYKKQELFTRFDHITFVFGAKEDITTLQAYLADLIPQLRKACTTRDQEAHHKPAPVLLGRQIRDLSKFTAHLKTKTPKDTSEKKSISKLNLDVYSQENYQKHNQKIIIKHEHDSSNIFCDDHACDKNIPEIRRSFINIMTGCNKYCTYCIVPFTRGREISYPMSQILTAVQQEVSQGSKEITLLGQNVNSYRDPGTGALFHTLLEKVALLSGDFWVRFFSPHPQDLTKDLFQVIAQYRPKLTACIHFPLQSGSNKILQHMNRNYTIEEYLTKVSWIQELLPGYTLSTDIIVGFPGETEEDYQETQKIAEQIQFDLIYSFIFSKRKYTKAYALPDGTPLAIKNKRLEKLQKVQHESALLRNSRLISTKIQVLVEKQDTHDKLLGRTEGNIRVLFVGPPTLIGHFVTVCIKRVTPALLYGDLINE
jgi:MiaB/RimO family radical SAM methylthiotransferase